MIQEHIEQYLTNFFKGALIPAMDSGDVNAVTDKSRYSIRIFTDGQPSEENPNATIVYYTLVQDVFYPKKELDLLNDIMGLKGDPLLNRHIMTNMFISNQLATIASDFSVPLTELEMFILTNGNIKDDSGAITQEEGTLFMIVAYHKGKQLMKSDGLPLMLTIGELTQGM